MALLDRIPIIHRIDIKLIKFLLVGVLNTAFGYSVFAVFIFLGTHYTVAVFFATVLGVLFNYRTIGGIVFNHKGGSKLIPFILVYVIIYALNVFGLWSLDYLGLENKYLAGAILLLPLALVSFVLNKKFVFN